MYSQYSECVWQRQGDDWVFGWKIRGIVRSPVAEIWFQDDLSRLGPETLKGQAGWAWVVRENYTGQNSGLIIGLSSHNLTAAVEACEKALGFEV